MADPGLNALLATTEAGIGLAEGTSLQKIKEEREGEEANFKTGQKVQIEAEPGIYRGIDQSSNKRGLLESGIEQRNVSNQFNKFATQRLAREGTHTRAQARLGNEAINEGRGGTAETEAK